MTAADGGLPLTGALPELADVPWRPLADEPTLPVAPLPKRRGMAGRLRELGRSLAGGRRPSP